MAQSNDPTGRIPQLRTRTIPKSGEAIPMVGLGTWQAFDVAQRAADRDGAREALRAFVGRGGTLVDSSPMYGSAEAVVGDLAADLGIHKSLFLATKVWTRGRAEGVRQMEASIAKMQSALKGPLDLMQVHNLLDFDVHWKTLRDWKAAGRVRYIGFTHYAASAHAEMERLVRTADPDFIQINYSIAEPEAGARLLPLAAERGVAVIVNRPFAEGAMFERVRGRAVPQAMADAYGATSWAQLFLKWILANPAVTCAIPGTRNPKHVLDNLTAATALLPGERGTFATPTATQRDAIAAAYRGA
jgi:diketogulonate reductase-like aldo/keto reductase